MSFTTDHLIPLLKDITNPRLYSTERGYQGHLIAVLENYIAANELFHDQTIVEQEYQKTMKHHSITQRPDIILHVPIEAGITADRTQHNYFVIALKLNGKKAAAMDDFGKLDEMFEKLNYPEGVFININSYPNVYLENYAGAFKSRINELSISLAEGTIQINHYGFTDDKLTSTKY